MYDYKKITNLGKLYLLPKSDISYLVYQIRNHGNHFKPWYTYEESSMTIISNPLCKRVGLISKTMNIFYEGSKHWKNPSRFYLDDSGSGGLASKRTI